MKTLAVVLIPVHFCIILFSSIFKLPLIPILGSCIFLPGFPRPQRVWPEVGGHFNSTDKDSNFYKHMFPTLFAQLQKIINQSGHLMDLSAGQFFLLRCEPYLVFGQVLESGFGYCNIVLKGCELQTTSCHTVEALKMDEILEQTLDQATTRSFFNKNIAYTYQGITSLEAHAYNITNNQLTGIIDDRQIINLIAKTFLRNLVWFLSEKCDHSLSTISMNFPKGWMANSVPKYDLQEVAHLFPKDLAMKLFTDAGNDGNNNNNNNNNHNNDNSEESMKNLEKIVMSCYCIINTLGTSGSELTPKHVLAIYNGQIPTSLYSDYLTANNADAQQLKQITVKAWRYAVKQLYDAFAEMNTDIYSEDNGEALTSYLEVIEGYQFSHVGIMGNEEWQQRVAAGHPNLFAIYAAEDENNKYLSKTLELSNITLKLATLRSVPIQSIWASLSLELLYFANDDDERYSIQSHPWLIRNLTVQVSEPPFGYPVFASKATIIDAL